MRTSILLVAASCLLVCAESRASVVWTLEESSGNLVLSTPGASIDLTGLSGPFSASSHGAIRTSGSLPGIFSGPPANATLSYYIAANTNPGFPFGTNSGFHDGSSGTGSVFGMLHELSSGDTIVYVPGGYVSGTPLGASSTTFVSMTFADLGIMGGSYAMVLGNGDSLTLNVVPEPSTYALVGLAGLLATSRRQRRKRKAGA